MWARGGAPRLGLGASSCVLACVRVFNRYRAVETVPPVLRPTNANKAL